MKGATYSMCTAGRNLNEQIRSMRQEINADFVCDVCSFGGCEVFYLAKEYMFSDLKSDFMKTDAFQAAASGS